MSGHVRSQELRQGAPCVLSQGAISERILKDQLYPERWSEFTILIISGGNIYKKNLMLFREASMIVVKTMTSPTTVQFIQLQQDVSLACRVRASIKFK